MGLTSIGFGLLAQALMVVLIASSQRVLWSWAHGPELSGRAALLLGFVSAVSLALLEVGCMTIGPWAIVIVVTGAVTLGAIHALVPLLAEEALLEPDVVPSPLEIDGGPFELRVQHVSRSALGSVLAVGLLPLGVGAFVAPIWRTVGARTVTLLVRGTDLLIDGVNRIGLDGAQVTTGIRPDGTPVIRVERGESAVVIPVGGQSADERHRLLLVLRARTVKEKSSVEEAPPALAQIRANARRSTAE